MLIIASLSAAAVHVIRAIFVQWDKRQTILLIILHFFTTSFANLLFNYHLVADHFHTSDFNVSLHTKYH